MPNLKKSVYFTICGEEIHLDVTWHMLEKAERVFSPYPVDRIPLLLENAIGVQRIKVADIIALWVQDKTKLTRDDIKGYFYQCPQIEYIRAVGKIQACLLWSIRDNNGDPLISDGAFEKLINGIDLDESDVKKPDEPKQDQVKSAKKTRAATSNRR